MIDLSPSKRLPVVRPETCPDTACEAPLDLPYLCGACGTLLREPPGLTHFERFGITPSFEVDLEALERTYMDLSRQLHPDRMVGRDTTVQGRALILSSALNEAYVQLKDRRLRAEHLLKLTGGKTAEQDKRTPQALLIEMLDLREEAEEARADGEAGQAALDRLRRRTADEQAACLTRVAALFTDEAFPTPELLDGIRLQLNVINYWVTLQDELGQ